MLAGDAVQFEPVSDANSLLTGKFTGNFIILGEIGLVESLEVRVVWPSRSKFPKQPNREILLSSRELQSCNREMITANAR